jgi:hypothetical protein
MKRYIRWTSIEKIAVSALAFQNSTSGFKLRDFSFGERDGGTEPERERERERETEEGSRWQ